MQAYFRKGLIENNGAAETATYYSVEKINLI